jgi:hypothetical protein
MQAPSLNTYQLTPALRVPGLAYHCKLQDAQNFLLQTDNATWHNRNTQRKARKGSKLPSGNPPIPAGQRQQPKAGTLGDTST